jgi:hypothetical protein
MTNNEKHILIKALNDSIEYQDYLSAQDHKNEQKELAQNTYGDDWASVTGVYSRKAKERCELKRQYRMLKAKLELEIENE